MSRRRHRRRKGGGKSRSPLLVKTTKGNVMQRQLVERELTNEGPGTSAPRKGGRSVTINLAESPLTWLHSRGHLSDVQFAAGKAVATLEHAGILAPVSERAWGRRWEAPDVFDLLDAFDQVAGSHRVQLTLVGEDRSWPPQRIEEHIRRSPHAKDVLWFRWAPEADLRRLK